MDIINRVKELVELMKESSDIAEIKISVSEDTQEVSVKRQTPETAVIAHHPAALPVAAPTHLPTPAPAAPTTSHANTSSDVNTDNALTSPMVGTVYLSSTPGAAPFVTIGQKVSEGEVLCLVEAMKMFNQIEADRAGTITARLIENGEPVEFGQPLFIIE